jgi:hypothetical protein
VALEIVNSPEQTIEVIPKQSQATITGATKHTPRLTGLVVMVNMESTFGGSLLFNSADLTAASGPIS